MDYGLDCGLNWTMDLKNIGRALYNRKMEKGSEKGADDIIILSSESDDITFVVKMCKLNAIVIIVNQFFSPFRQPNHTY